MKFEMNTEEFKVFCEQVSVGVYQSNGNMPPSVDTTDQLLSKLSVIFYAVNTGQKINAIKLLRELTSCGLKEAKDTVEGVYQPHMPEGSRRSF